MTAFLTSSDTAHAWWSRLRHQGLLLSPVVMVERYPTAPPAAHFSALGRLRDARTRFASRIEGSRDGDDRNQAAILGFVDALLEDFLGHKDGRLTKQHNIPDNVTTVVRIGSRSETIRPHRVIFADQSGTIPAVLVMADTSPQVGRGRGRTAYSRFLELLRGTGHRLGLLTNGQQFRLIYAGLDFESWCEWESDRWFDDSEGTEELCGLRQLLSPESLKPVRPNVSGLLDAVEESRKRQADLSSVLRENVRQAVELLLDEVSTANRTKSDLFTALKQHDGDRTLSDSEAHEALLQATVRVVMRLVVCLFAESRQLLPVNDPIFAQSYGVRSLYELLDEVIRYEGGTHALFNRQTAWPRLMALFRLIHGGSAHGAFPLRPYGGVLFRPGDDSSSDPVARALHILEYNVAVGDATIYHVLRKLLRGPLPVIKGKSKTFVDGPVDYTDLRTEFIGLIYEGLLDYHLKRTDEQFGPQVFLNLGREPVLPLRRLEDMLADDPRGLKDLLTTLRKEKVTASAAEKEDEQEEADEEALDGEQSEEPATDEPAIETDSAADQVQRTGDYLDAFQAARGWARKAIVLAGLFRKQRKKESDSQYQQELESEADRLIRRVVATGEFYLVRAGNTRKGTGTFYTRPQLAVPTTHRTLQPLCYEKAEDGTLTPKEPEAILGLKVCDPACGSASFLVAALHYLTDAVYKSLCLHRNLYDPEKSKQLTLPYGRPRTNGETDQLVPFPPNDPQRGHTFEDRIKALLRRHVVERCIYGVDINPLAVEFARVSLWVETLDPELPFSFLDHKIKVGNSLIGCWLDRVEDYPIKAWEREGGDGKKGPRTGMIQWFLRGGEVTNPLLTDRAMKTGKKGDGIVKQEMREYLRNVADRAAGQQVNLPGLDDSVVNVAAEARAEYERLHDLPIAEPEQHEAWFRNHIQLSPAICALKAAMDEWCALWFWPSDGETLFYAPTPLLFHQPAAEKDVIVARIADDLKFFHWEIEFPDAFTPTRNGFDCMLGNPPWEVMKIDSHEFFSDYDPIYRTFDKTEALNRQTALLEKDDGVADAWITYCEQFKSLSNWVKNVATYYDVALSKGKEAAALENQWAAYRQRRNGTSTALHPFRHQGSADLNAYKLFSEQFLFCLRKGGRVGIIIPTGIYADVGTLPLRQQFLLHGQVELLYSFQNEKRVFAAAHHTKKQVVLVAAKGGTTHSFRTRFRMGVGDSPDAQELPNDLLNADQRCMEWTPADLSATSPGSWALVQLRSQVDKNVFVKLYENSFRIGEVSNPLDLQYGREFDTSIDSELLMATDRCEADGFVADVFGRYIDRDGKVAFPVYQGALIHQLNSNAARWVQGSGKSAVWANIAPDEATLHPNYVMSGASYQSSSKRKHGWKIVYRRIGPPTNSRSLIATVIGELPTVDSLFLLQNDALALEALFSATGILNSFVFDFCLRQRLVGDNISKFVIYECPLPSRLLDLKQANAEGFLAYVAASGAGAR